MLKCTLDSPVIARGPRAGLIIGGGEGSPAQPSVTTKAGVTQVLGHPESTSKSSASCLSFQVPSQFSIGDPTFSLDSWSVFNHGLAINWPTPFWLLNPENSLYFPTINHFGGSMWNLRLACPPMFLCQGNGKTVHSPLAPAVPPVALEPFFILIPLRQSQSKSYQFHFLEIHALLPPKTEPLPTSPFSWFWLLLMPNVNFENANEICYAPAQTTQLLAV